MHKRLYKLLILGWTASYGCGPANTVRPQQPIDSSVAVVSQPKGPAAISDSTVVALQHKSALGMPFDSVKKKYRTLIPILNGLFLTYDKLDYEQYRKLIRLQDIDSFFRHGKNIYKRFSQYGPLGYGMPTLKWGVIDSAGNTILPFVCDAVRAIDAQKGIFSVVRITYTLNTGLQRFRYEGDCFFFDKKGIKDTIGIPFKANVEFVCDYARDAPPVQQGPAFYLPKPYHKMGRMARGTIKHY
jgi:hypothetical protein